MSKGVKKHPPKKKHPIRPRPDPIVPLTDDERLLYARQEFRKAEIHLSEAETLARAGTTPNACAHAAYYAMYHCAAAYLLAAGGVGKNRSIPASHTHIIEHYAKAVADEKGPLAATGLQLSRAQTSRDAADYDLTRNVEQRDAAEQTVVARSFLEACNGKWRLR